MVCIVHIYSTLCSVFSLFPSVGYFSDESSSSTASSNAGGGESDSDSSYCPTSYSCESETGVKKGPVLGSIVVHPLVLQFIEPLTGTEGPSCSKQPESVVPVCSAVWSNLGWLCEVVPDCCLLIPSIRSGVAKPKSVMEIWCEKHSTGRRLLCILWV